MIHIWKSYDAASVSLCDISCNASFTNHSLRRDSLRQGSLTLPPLEGILEGSGRKAQVSDQEVPRLPPPVKYHPASLLNFCVTCHGLDLAS